jgi:hypothetical protein
VQRREVMESRIVATRTSGSEGGPGRRSGGEAANRASVRPYYVKVRESGRVTSMAALVATGVAASGERRVLGLELAPGNDEGSAWPGFIRRLVARGLAGVCQAAPRNCSRAALTSPGGRRSAPNRSRTRAAAPIRLPEDASSAFTTGGRAEWPYT